MIALFSVALAATLSADPEAPSAVWLDAGFRPLVVDPKTCAASPAPDADPYPPGTPAEVVRVTLPCGLEVLDVAVRIPPSDDSEFQRARFNAPLDAPLRTTPPKSTGKPARVAYVAGRSLARGVVGETAIPVGAAERAPQRLAEGERVEVLADGASIDLPYVDPSGRSGRTRPYRTSLVALPGGRRYLVLTQRLHDADPLPEHRRRLADRLAAGRANRSPLAPLPDAETVLAEPKAHAGRPYTLWVSPYLLSAPEHGDFMDPIGQVSRNACPKGPPDRWQRLPPCGAFWLDYTPLGAWWPDRITEALVVLDGTVVVEGERMPRVRVMVTDPWGQDTRVSPEWDR